VAISDWFDMMADEVTIYPFTGRNVSNVPTYGPTGTVYPAYIHMKNHLVVGKDGRTITARGYIILGTTAVIGIEDKIVLPSDYVPVSPPILDVNLEPDEDGNHHTKLEIG
jgi:hypothetical protein